MNDTLPYGGTTPYKYHWDFGDGTQTPFKNTTYTYTTTGCNTITLSIQDSTGKTTSTTTAAIIKKKHDRSIHQKKTTKKRSVLQQQKIHLIAQTIDPRTNRHHGRNLLKIPNHTRQIPQ
jgi:PKD repeat protein